MAPSGSLLDQYVPASVFLAAGHVDDLGRHGRADIFGRRAIEQRRLIGEDGNRRAAAVAVRRQAGDNLGDRRGHLFLGGRPEAADVAQPQPVVQRRAEVVPARHRDDLSVRGRRLGGRRVGGERRREQLGDQRVPRIVGGLEQRHQALEFGIGGVAGFRVRVVTELLDPGGSEKRVRGQRAAEVGHARHRLDDPLEDEFARLARPGRVELVVVVPGVAGGEDRTGRDRG